MEYFGTVTNGVIVLEETNGLPEGTRVRVSPLTPASEETLGLRMLKFAGKAKNLPSDMAEQHDHYLHGRPKK